ncbi:MAG TPA: hypothetical protein ENI85_18570 [Deltaproteobacteria bacterium]|nr:hypothetical protein [Deltaproteobacteria bacterium]
MKRIFGTALLGLLLAGLVAADAAAGDRWNVPANRGQQSVVEQIDVAGRTLTLGGTVYSVSPGARITDSNGNAILLRDLHAVGSPRPADFVEFWSRRSGRNGMPEVTRLRVKPAMKF